MPGGKIGTGLRSDFTKTSSVAPPATRYNLFSDI
jgi:hypothetical protein